MLFLYRTLTTTVHVKKASSRLLLYPTTGNKWQPTQFDVGLGLRLICRMHHQQAVQSLGCIGFEQVSCSNMAMGSLLACAISTSFNIPGADEMIFRSYPRQSCSLMAFLS